MESQQDGLGKKEETLVQVFTNSQEFVLHLPPLQQMAPEAMKRK